MWILLALIGCSSTPATSAPVQARPKGLHAVQIDELIDELHRHRDNPRVYNFWATWCSPCIAELPALKAFGTSHPEIDLIFINVDIPKMHNTKVKSTIRRFELDKFEHLALADDDPAGSLLKIDGWPNSVPVTLVVRPDGARVRQFNVAVQPNTLRSAVREASQ